MRRDRSGLLTQVHSFFSEAGCPRPLPRARGVPVGILAAGAREGATPSRRAGWLLSGPCWEGPQRGWVPWRGLCAGEGGALQAGFHPVSGLCVDKAPFMAGAGDKGKKNPCPAQCGWDPDVDQQTGRPDLWLGQGGLDWRSHGPVKICLFLRGRLHRHHRH